MRPHIAARAARILQTHTRIPQTRTRPDERRLKGRRKLHIR